MTMDIFEIKAAFFTIIDSVDDNEIPSERIQDMRELTAAGDTDTALESLCSNLDDFDIAITEDILSLIREIGQAMRINPKYWERLVVKE